MAASVSDFGSLQAEVEILVKRATVLERYERKSRNGLLGLVRARTSEPRWA